MGNTVVIETKKENKLDTWLVLLITLVNVYSGFYADLETFNFSLVISMMVIVYYLTNANERIKNICLGLILLITCVVMFREFYPELWTKFFYPNSYQAQQIIEDIIKQARDFNSK